MSEHLDSQAEELYESYKSLWEELRGLQQNQNGNHEITTQHFNAVSTVKRAINEHRLAALDYAADNLPELKEYAADLARQDDKEVKPT